MTDQSGSSRPVVPAAVSDLIEESQTIQGWIERLAGHAGEARPEVFERVLGDYQERLEKVTGTLAQHRADLAASLDGRQAEVETLQADRDSHAAELEEARLRHAVGEYSDRKWDDRREAIEGSLGELDELLDIEKAAVGELTGIIDSMEAGEAPPQVQGPAAVEVRDEPEIVVERVDDVESVDDVEVIDETAAEDLAEAAEASAGADGDVDDGDVDDGDDYVDELEFLESLSLDESDKFDAVSAMLDDEEEGEKKDG